MAEHTEEMRREKWKPSFSDNRIEVEATGHYLDKPTRRSLNRFKVEVSRSKGNKEKVLCHIREFFKIQELY